MVVMATKPMQQWAEQITAEWRKSIESIFKVGEMLCESREQAEHGQWTVMVRNSLPFRESTAQALMKISRDQRLRKAHQGGLLPSCWRTLDELTRLDDEQFERALRDGVICAGMTRADLAWFLQ